MPYHKDLGLNNIHRIHNFEYADASERTGASVDGYDIGKVARQLDDDTYYILTDTAPTWLQLGGGGGSGTVTATEGADGYLAFFTGSNTIAGDNDLFWERDNNRLRVDGYIIPGTDNVHDLGTPSQRWHALHVGPGSVHIHSSASETGQSYTWSMGIDTTTGNEGRLLFLQGESTFMEMNPATGKTSLGGGNLNISERGSGINYTTQVNNPIATVQSDSEIGESGSATKVFGLGSAPQAGNTILLGIYLSSSSRTVSSVTQTGVTWSQHDTQVQSSRRTDMWIGEVGSSPGSTITIELSGGNWNTTSDNITAVEFQGINPTVVDSNFQNKDWAFDPMTGSSVTTFDVGDVIVSFIAFTQTNSSSIIDTATASNGDTTNIEISAEQTIGTTSVEAAFVYTVIENDAGSFTHTVDDNPNQNTIGAHGTMYTMVFAPAGGQDVEFTALKVNSINDDLELQLPPSGGTAGFNILSNTSATLVSLTNDGLFTIGSGSPSAELLTVGDAIAIAEGSQPTSEGTFGKLWVDSNGELNFVDDNSNNSQITLNGFLNNTYPNTLNAVGSIIAQTGDIIADEGNLKLDGLSGAVSLKTQIEIAPGVAQSKVAARSDGSVDTTFSLDSPISAGSFLVLGAGFDLTTSDVVSITQSGVSWSLRSRTENSTNYATEVWIGTVTSASPSQSITVTTTDSITTNDHYSVVEVQGVSSQDSDIGIDSTDWAFDPMTGATVNAAGVGDLVLSYISFQTTASNVVIDTASASTSDETIIESSAETTLGGDTDQEAAFISTVVVNTSASFTHTVDDNPNQNTIGAHGVMTTLVFPAQSSTTLDFNAIQMGSYNAIDGYEAIHFNLPPGDFNSKAKFRNATTGNSVLTVDKTGLIGINTDYPHEALTVSGALSLQELGDITRNHDGYGTLYVKASDSKLYFRDDSGTETDLTSGGGGITATEGADGYVAFFTGSDSIAGDNDLFWDRVNNGLLIGGNGTTAGAKLQSRTTVEGGKAFRISRALSYDWDFEVVGTSDLTIGPNGGTPRLYLEAVNPKVGIAMSSDPVSNLDVAGNVTIGGSFAGTNAGPTSGLLVEGKLIVGGGTSMSGTGVQGAEIRSSSSGHILALSRTGGYNYYLDINSSGDFDIMDNNGTTSRLHIQVSDGNVGLGTQSPQNKLDISGAATIGSTYAGSQAAPTDGLAIEGFTSIGFVDTGKPLNVHFTHNSTIDQVRFRNSGTGDSGMDLDLRTADTAMLWRVYNKGNTTSFLTWDAAGMALFRTPSGTSSNASRLVFGTGSDVPINFITNDISRMTLSSLGHLGIGTELPIEPLTINGPIALQELADVPATQDGYGKLYTDSAGELAYVDDEGNQIQITLSGAVNASGSGVQKTSGFTGADGYVAFFTGNNEIAGDNDLFYNRASGTLEINGANSNAILVYGDGGNSLRIQGPLVDHPLALDTAGTAIIQAPANRSLGIDVLGNGTSDRFFIGVDTTLSGGPVNFEAFTVSGDGNVGIHEDSPAFPLHVNATVTDAAIEGTNSTGLRILGEGSNFTKIIGNINTHAVLGEPAGRILGPGARSLAVEINGNGAADRFAIITDPSNGSSADTVHTSFYNDGRTTFHSSSDTEFAGNVGIGITPTAKLHVDGGGAIPALFVGDGDSGLRISGDGGALIEIMGNQTTHAVTGVQTGRFIGPGNRAMAFELSGNGNTDRFCFITDPDLTGGADTEVFTIQQDGTVGIGRTAPLSALEVQGAINVYNDATAAISLRSFEDPPAARVQFISARGTEASPSPLSTAGDVLGKLRFLGQISTSPGGFQEHAYIQVEANQNGSWATSTNRRSDITFANYHNDGGGLFERMRIRYDGNIGIGSTDPSALLTLNRSSGDPNISLAIADTVKFTIGVDDSDADSFKIGTTAVETGTSLTIDSSGRVGIGASATTPTAPLLVKVDQDGITDFRVSNASTATGGEARILIQNDVASSAIEMFGSNYSGTIGGIDAANVFTTRSGSTATGGMIVGTYMDGTRLRFMTGNLVKATLDGIGNLGIGPNSDNPVATLMVNGAIAIQENNAPGDNHDGYGKLYTGTDSELHFIDDSGNDTQLTTAPSDIRLKQNIEIIGDALNKISAIRGVYYEWNELAHEYSNRVEGQRRLGVIAQEIEKVVPEAVNDNKEYKSLEYEQLVPLLIEAVKELKRENEILKGRLDNIEETKK